MTSLGIEVSDIFSSGLVIVVIGVVSSKLFRRGSFLGGVSSKRWFVGGGTVGVWVVVRRGRMISRKGTKRRKETGASSSLFP
jgi:hypothetical protein